MADPTIEARVATFVAEQFGLQESEVKPTTSFINDLGADSLDLVELLYDFEAEFSLEIEDEAFEKLETVQQVIDFVTTAVASQAGKA